MNYDRILTVLAKRYRMPDTGLCYECDQRMDDHREWCPGWHYAKKVMARALREKGRTS